MTPSQEDTCGTFYHSIADHLEDIVVSEVTEIKSGRKRLAVSVGYEDEDGDSMIYPLGILFSGDENPFDLYNFDSDPQPKIEFQEASPWWRRFWPF